YLLVMGLLLGYLAEQQKQLRAEKAVVARVLGKARVEAGLSGTLQEIVGELISMYGARAALIASREANSHRVFVGEMRLGSRTAFQWLDPLPSDRETYLYSFPAETYYASASNRQGAFSLVGLDRTGAKVLNLPPAALERLAKQHEFQNLMVVSFSFGHEWWGRIFLLDLSLTGDVEEELRFLHELVQQVGPAVYNVYLLRRLRLRAGALERARFARELHDGAVQSLIAMEMQVDVLRRTSDKSVSITDELGRIQGLLREGLVNVRKHSRARQVLVRLGSKNQHWTLVMEDDGCGFPFAGRLSHLEEDTLGRGPLVIKERVRLIDGELAIESVPGQGSRLEINVPQKREAAYG